MPRSASSTAEPARSDRVRHLSRAGAAREFHQRQASPQAGDAGTGWPAAAHPARDVQHRRVRGDRHRRAARPDRPSAVVMRECRSSDPRQLAQCERDIVAESAQIARNSREDADLSLRRPATTARAARLRRRSEVADSDFRGTGDVGHQRPALPRSPGRRGAHVDQRDVGRPAAW